MDKMTAALADPWDDTDLDDDVAAEPAPEPEPQPMRAVTTIEGDDGDTAEYAYPYAHAYFPADAPDGSPDDAPDGAEPTAGIQGVRTAALTWRTTLRRFWSLTAGHRHLMVIALVAFTLAIGGDAVGLFVLSDLIDGALSTGRLASFWAPAALWAGIALASAGCTYLGSVSTVAAAEHFQVALREQVHDHLLRLSPRQLDRRSLGDVISRVVDDAAEVENLVVSELITGIAGVISLAVFATAAVIVSWRLVVVVFLTAPLLWVANCVLAGPTRRLSQRTREAHGAVTAAVEQTLGNTALVQISNGQPGERRRLARAAGELLTSRIRAARLAAVQGPLTEVVETAGLLLVLGVGTVSIAAGQLTVGGLLAFMAFLAFLLPALTSMSALRLVAAESGTSAVRLTELLDLTPQVQAPGEPATPDAQGTSAPAARLAPEPLLEIDEVSLRDADGCVRLAPLSLRVRRGELVMITGPSGCGKSSLLHLLVRFADPTDGTIRFDGTDLRTWAPTDLRERVGLLLQEAQMFDDTLRANLRYGVPEAVEPSLELLAGLGLDRIAARLPNGWDTSLGQRGRSLSGGERQRVALARALLRPGDVLLLDEPTTGLDARAGRQAMEVIRAASRDRAVIMVTHNPAVEPYADRIVRLSAPAELSSGRRVRAAD